MSAGRMTCFFVTRLLGTADEKDKKRGGAKTLGDNLRLASDGNDFVTFQHW